MSSPKTHSRGSVDDAMLAMRATSHFLEHVAPKMEDFREKHKRDFEEHVKDDNFDVGEFTTSQYEAYGSFTDMFETGMQDFLAHNASLPDFNRVMKKGIEDMKREGHDDFGGSMAGLFVELLDAVGDFQGFVKFMRSEPPSDDDDDAEWDMPQSESKSSDDKDEEDAKLTHK